MRSRVCSSAAVLMVASLADCAGPGPEELTASADRPSTTQPDVRGTEGRFRTIELTDGPHNVLKMITDGGTSWVLLGATVPASLAPRSRTWSSWR